MEQIEGDADIQKHWQDYQEKYDYATMFEWPYVLAAINKLFEEIGY
ncbi:MAG: hypothetical protein IJM25_04270 [Eubacterium sp.]|nr:hypothetical protein [Eubacterium sp.]